MKTFASRWGLLLLVTVIAGVAIVVIEPDYNKLQTAKDVAGFKATLDGDRTRALIATCFDFVFAAGYGTLLVAALRAMAPTRTLAVLGTVLALGGAVADELENLLVFTNVGRNGGVNIRWIDLMKLFGTAKTVLLAAALVLLVVLLIRRAVSRST
jgi:hypothetical protein